MIRFSLLGSVELTGPDGRQILSVLAQPKRVALLAYLAAAGGSVRRDTLLGLFWPESDEEHARHALRQSLYSLRRSLGPRVIESRGDEELFAEPSRLWCDALAFEEAVTGSQPRKALDLYSGDLLEGFFLSDAPGFEKWLDGRRATLRGRAAEAAWALAEEAEGEGSASEAAEWARKAAEYAPDDESSLQRLVALLDRIGDRAAALRAYEAFAWRLESELGAQPSPETQALMQDIRSRSTPEPAADSAVGRVTPTLPVQVGSPSSRPDESFLAGPPTLARDSDPDARPSVVETGDREAAQREPDGAYSKKHRALVGVVVAALAAAAAIIDGAEVARWAASWFSSGAQGTAQPQVSMARPADLDPRRIAVLYFDDLSQDQSLAHIASGFTETLIGQLSQIEGLAVISRRGVKPFRNGQVTLDSIIKVLEPGTIVEGSVMGEAGLIRVNVQLIDAATSAYVGHQVLERPASQTLALLDDLSSQVVEFLRERLGDVVRTRRLQAGTESQEAWTRVQRAELAQGDADRLRLTGNNEQATRLYARADTLLAEAEELDPEWVEPIVLRSRVAAGQARLTGDTPIRYDRAAIEVGIAHATRALELSPGNVSALELRGSLYADIALGQEVAAGKEYQAALDSAFADSETAVASDPQAAGAWATLSVLNIFLGRFEEARLDVERALDADAFLERAVDIYYLAARTALDQHELMEAVYWLDRGLARAPGDKRLAAVRLVAAASGAEIALDDAWNAVHVLERTQPENKWPSHWLKMSAVLARAGFEDSARSVIERAHQADTDDAYVSYYEANARLLLGERAEALRLLRQFLRRLPNMRNYVAGDWWFESLQDDPEFQSMVAATD